MKKIISLVLCMLICFGAAAMPVTAESTYTYPSLYRAYEDYFDISVAVEPGDLDLYPQLAKNQFNVIVTENQLKPWIHKGEDSWYWAGADKIVNYALENDKKVRAHTLVCPAFFDDYSSNELKWFYRDEEGNSLFDEEGNPVEGAKELTLARLENHVKTIVKRYKGKIYAYDVVNEAYKEYGINRAYTKFCKLLGDDEWILKCFQWAYEADPDAVLIYNDNGYTTDIAKQEVIYNKIKEIRDAGIPANIGMQMHYGAEIRLDLVENLFNKFSGLCDIYITELDMGMSSKMLTDTITTDSTGLQKKSFETKTYPDYMHDEAAEIQARKYGSLFDLFRKYSDFIKCVGFWNISDGRTYQGTAKMPLVFDKAGEPKSAFYRILDFEQVLPRWEETDKLPKYRAIDYNINPETDTIIVKGTTDTKTTAKAVLFNPGFEEGLEETEYINNQKTITADGEFEIEIPISYTQLFANPSYKLKLSIEGQDDLWENITYYSPKHKEGGYKIYDDLNDFSKMHSFYNVSLSSCLSFYEDDSSGIVYSSDQLADRFIMYRVPDDRIVSGVTVNAYVYENTLWSGAIPKVKPQISGSADGSDFTELSDIASWGNEIPKVLHNDVAAAKQRRHFKCKLEIDESSGIKYIKIDMNDFWANWHVYIEDVEINTALDESYEELKENCIIAEEFKLFAHTSSKKLQTAIAHSGTVSGTVDVENHTDAEKTLMYVIAQKHNGRLEAINCDTVVLKPAEEKTFSAMLENCTILNGSEIEMFLFDMTQSQLTPVNPKSVFCTMCYPDMILHDDFADFSEMYSSSLKTFDVASWSFDDVTLTEQTE